MKLLQFVDRESKYLVAQSNVKERTEERPLEFISYTYREFEKRKGKSDRLIDLPLISGLSLQKLTPN